LRLPGGCRTAGTRYGDVAIERNRININRKGKINKIKIGREGGG
jgi:hypothetical protein